MNSQGKSRRVSIIPIALRGQTTGRSVAALFFVAVFTAAVVGLRLLNEPALATAVDIPLVLIVVGFALAARFGIVEQVGATQVLLTAIEVPLILGLFSLAPTGVVGKPIDSIRLTVDSLIASAAQNCWRVSSVPMVAKGRLFRRWR